MEAPNLNYYSSNQMYEFIMDAGDLRKILRGYLEIGLFTDCTIVASCGKAMNLHKIVLASASDHLAKILLMRSSDANPVLVFSELNYPDLVNAVTFMYNGSLTIVEENLDGFMQAAKVLQIKSITPGFPRGYPTIPDPEKVDPAHSERNSTSSSSSSFSESESSDRSVRTSPLKPIPTACRSSKVTKKSSATKSTGSQPKTSSASPNNSVFQCVFCSKQFRAKRNTMVHQSICARNPNRKVFQCKSCPQKFTRKSRLVAHEKKHDPEKAEAETVPEAFRIGRK